MAKIPQQVMVSPRAVGVQAPAGAFNASTQAIARLGNTVNASVDGLIEQGMRAQKIRNQEDIRKTAREMELMREEFMQSVEEGNVDPAQWVPQWEQTLRARQASLIDKSAPPEVVNAVKTNYDIFSKESMLQINGSALKENQRRAKKGFSVDLEHLMKQGRFDEANALVAGSGDILDPEEIRGFSNGVMRAKQEANLELDKNADPIAFRAAVEQDKYNLSPILKKRYLEDADEEISKHERKSLTEVKDLMDGGAFTTKEQLSAELEKYPEISQIKRNVLVKSFEVDTPITDEERFAIGDQIRDNFTDFREGRISLKEYRKKWNETDSAVIAFGNRTGVGSLKNLSYQKDPMHFTEEDTLENEARDRANKEVRKTTEETIKEVARQRVGAQIGVARAKFRKDKDPASYPVENAKFSDTQNAFGVQLRTALERETENWANSLQTPPTGPEIEDYVNRIQPTLVSRILSQREQLKSQNGPRKQSGGVEKTQSQILLESWTSPK